MLTHTKNGVRLPDRPPAGSHFFRTDPLPFAAFYRRYRYPIYRQCLHYLKDPKESEDVTMEIFEYLVVHPEYQGITYLWPWLMRLTRNRCLSRIDQQIRRRRYLQFFRRGWNWYQQEPGRSRLADQQLELLQHGIRQLKPQQRNCLLRFYLDGLSYQIIAQEMDLTPQAVKSHIQNGRRNLRNFIQRQ